MKINRSKIIRYFAVCMGLTLSLWMGDLQAIAQELINGDTTAQLKLSSVFCDHLVLQREKPIRVWGWAPPGETVTVEFSGQTKATKTDSHGKWQVSLAPLPASAEGKILVVRAGCAEKKITDVVVGEVWFCSGQSNMAISVGEIGHAAEEQKEAENPQLRFFLYAQEAAEKPQDDVKNGQWYIAGPQTINYSYATAYYLGKMLQKEIGIPVGLIQGAIGGTPIEAWMARETLASEPEMDQIAETGLKLNEEGENKNKGHAARGGDPQKNPWPMWRVQQTPTFLYNGMIHPFTPLTIRGFIWYQAEHNLGNPKAYAKLFPAHIKGWRTAWGLGDLPFYYCQLPGLLLKGGTVPEGNLAQMRLIQAQAQTLPKTGMAVIYDTAEEADNHPKNKRPAGERLARLALAKEYEKKIAYSGPVFAGMRIEGSKVRVSFEHLDGGLFAREIPGEYRPVSNKPETKPVIRTSPGSQLEGFALAGADSIWVWADAKIDGDSVLVWSDKVTTPVAVRYAYSDFGFFNLFNKAGLPAAPFRTDDGSAK
jgi:sialate O-acetylesterase